MEKALSYAIGISIVGVAVVWSYTRIRESQLREMIVSRGPRWQMPRANPAPPGSQSTVDVK